MKHSIHYVVVVVAMSTGPMTSVFLPSLVGPSTVLVFVLGRLLLCGLCASLVNGGGVVAAEVSTAMADIDGVTEGGLFTGAGELYMTFSICSCVSHGLQQRMPADLQHLFAFHKYTSSIR